MAPPMSDAGHRQSWSRAALERAALALGIVLLFACGYFGVGLSMNPARARALATPLDDRIPFLPSTIWLYLWAFPASLSPLFLVRCPRLFRRTALAYAIAIIVSLTCFVIAPVTSLGLRINPATLDVSRFSHWAIAVLYAIDPPYNLFPSLHLSIATLGAFAAWKASCRYGAAMLAGAGLVGASICTIKQHFLVDGLAALALAALVHALTLRPYCAPPGWTPARSWRGPAAFLVFATSFYAGCYALFRWMS
ncbi:MAG TPA: phosphatase PAP2 family protein [Verrucomicrobiae bacterium]|nr:phosphatase PAP2 family protein [Verrucomicrobiae bacterium]